MSSPAGRNRVSRKIESVPTRSQPQDGINCNSYSAARTRVSCRMESAVSRIQPPELESTRGWSQS